MVINELVCEGCGDCGVKSNCVSVQPLETEWGRKRTIDQSSCNKDYSCIKGFCPSFVTVHGGKPKKPVAVDPSLNPPLKGEGLREAPGRGQGVDSHPTALPSTSPLQGEVKKESLPDPVLPKIGEPYGIIVTGIGGTGVVTIGGVLGMAAHLEGKGVGIIDMAGLAQKGGAVYSHIRISNEPEDIHAIRIAAGGADLVLGGDIVVAGNKKVLAAVKHGSTKMMINTAEFLPGDFTRNADFSLPTERLKRAIIAAAGADSVSFVDASRLATALLGNSIAANIFLVGYAYQNGALPLSAESIEKAIEMNGEAVAMNQAAFRWGRRAAHDVAAVEKQIPTAASQDENRRLSESLEEIVARRVEFLTNYQDAAYAKRYSDFVGRAIKAEAEKAKGRTGLADAVARNLFKLMAYKDEYEVARLYTSGAFDKALRDVFAGDVKLTFHLAPPLLGRRDAVTGHLKKSTFGPWLLGAMRILSRFRGLRGTAFDPFGRTAERRMERQLVADYRADMEMIASRFGMADLKLALELAYVPEQIRGFGHVKAANAAAAAKRRSDLLSRLQQESLPKAAE